MRVVLPTLTAVALVATLSACHHRGGQGGWTPTTQTRAEFAASLDQRFQRMDRNNDGAIQPEELQRRHGGDGNGSGGDNTAAGDHGGGGGGGGGGRMAARMMRMDTNHDGEISRAEFTAGSMAQFDAADTNHDGTVTVEEWQGQRDHWRQEHGGDPDGAGNASTPAPANSGG